MSGGQQQRIAIARALASEPDILLLDEPFAALDPALRERLQRGLRDVQREFGLVVLCVTHNLEDAFAIGDRLAVVHDGQVTQVGAVDEVFQRPANLRAAESMGVRNLIHARVTGASADGVALDWDGLSLEAPPQHAVPGEMAPLYIRPEDVKLLYDDRGVGEALRRNQVVGTVVAREDSGRVHHLVRRAAERPPDRGALPLVHLQPHAVARGFHRPVVAAARRARVAPRSRGP